MYKKYLIPIILIVLIFSSLTLISASYNVSLSQGWNLISQSIGPKSSNSSQEITLNSGWNLIGYSSENDFYWLNATITKGIETKNISEAASAGLIQLTAYYYDNDVYRLVPGNDDYLRNRNGYWVYAFTDGLKLTLTNSGGSMPYNKYLWQKAAVSNLSEIKSLSDAESLGWIQSTLYYYDDGYQFVDMKSDLNPWSGYWLYSFKDNLTLTMPECITDSDCNDNNPDTMDRCQETQEGMACTHLIPNFYGKIYDTDTGNPIEGVNISFYDADIYDVYDNIGNYSALVPKEIPDLVTEEGGIFKVFLIPNESYHMVMQHSDEKAFGVNGKNNQNKTIITENEGYIKVFFEKASASLLSDLYIDFPVQDLLVENSEVGKTVYINNNQSYPAGTELKFHIRVHGTHWGLGEYDHSSDSKYCEIEKLDENTWRLHFEDLPSNRADWDYNDAVVLIDVVASASGGNNYTNDCDEDGIVNWEDDDDDECDIGEDNQEIDENVTGGFNAEGHILYYDKYGKDNKYTCGDVVKFVMFGKNHRNPDETITFLVESHVTNPGTDGDIVYIGNISDEDENLFVPNDEVKYHKTYEFIVPCSYSEGKYDIHIVWKGEKWHKIGNFFVIDDTTDPWINVFPSNGIPDIPIEIGYSAHDPPEPGTVTIYEICTTNRPDYTINVSIDKDILTDGDDNDTITDNDVDYLVPGGSAVSANITYDSSGSYTARFKVTDVSGNSDYEDKEITVYISEDEADVIAYPIYEMFGLTLEIFFKHNYETTIGTSSPNIFLEADRFNWGSEIGDEYMTPGDNIHSEDDSNSEEDQIAGLNAVLYSTIGGTGGCKGPEYLKPIYPSTAKEYNNTLAGFLTYLYCVCGHTPSGPSCNWQNFAPVIADYEPKTNPNNNQEFEILARDPNNDNVTCSWYVDNNFQSAGSCSWTYSGDPSGHSIKAVASDIYNATSEKIWAAT